MNSNRAVILGLISKGIRRAAGAAGRKAVKISLLFTIFTIVLMGFLYQVVFSIEADAAVGDSAVNAAKGKWTAASKVEGTAAKAEEGSTLPVENDADSTNPQKRKALKKYADSLGNLYGQSFYGSLSGNYHVEEPSERWGFDTDSIPVTTAGSYIFDYDQDGTDELLAVEINEDHTMNLVMYEVDDDLRVFRASSVPSVILGQGYRFPLYIGEQGPASLTDIFLFEYQGPTICIQSGGRYLQKDATRQGAMFFKYGNQGFIPEPKCFCTESGQSFAYSSTRFEDFRKAGLVLLPDSATLSATVPFIDYCEQVHEIVRVDGELDWKKYDVFHSDHSGNSVDVVILRFKDEDELYGR